MMLMILSMVSPWLALLSLGRRRAGQASLVRLAGCDPLSDGVVSL